MALKFEQRYLRQYSSFALLTKKEREMVDEIKKYGKSDSERKEEKQKKLETEMGKYSGTRAINIYQKDNEDFAETLFLQIKKNKVISFFENELTRYIDKNHPDTTEIVGKDKKLLHSVIVIEIYNNHLELINQIVKNGIYIKRHDSNKAVIEQKRFVFLTSSSGQQRNNKLVMVDEAVYSGYSALYTCGLTLKSINEKKVNRGKYIAYTALPLSASKPISIDIDRVIVVPDLMMQIDKDVEYIDNQTFEHTVMKMPDSLNQTDGCGMVLPALFTDIQEQLGLDYNISGLQIRAPWIKGALFPFAFDEFAGENKKVIDLDNVSHDIVNEGIQVILTKSQWKMCDKYSSWDEYKKYFKDNKLSFCVTNVSNPTKDTTKLTYQFLQTLDRGKASNENIAALCDMTVNHIKALHTDKAEALKVFGIYEGNQNKKPLQEALTIYPDLLSDTWVLHKVQDAVRAYRSEALGGRIDVKGFFGYAQPDLYAFCEYLFNHDPNPKGLIDDDSVFCPYYADQQDIDTVDLLRSPHLENAHTVRKLFRSEDCEKWFAYCGQNIIYSVRDYLMLAVMGDVDGDTLLISPSKELQSMVSPHNVLYYKMFKAKPNKIDDKGISNTLRQSFACNYKSNSIGYISNAITKLWNTDYNGSVVKTKTATYFNEPDNANS